MADSLLTVLVTFLCNSALAPQLCMHPLREALGTFVYPVLCIYTCKYTNKYWPGSGGTHL